MSKNQINERFHENRMFFFKLGALFLIGIFSLRSFQLFFFSENKETLSQIASRQYFENITLSPYRGMILDRNGDPLAITIKKPSYWIDPQVFFKNPPQTVKETLSFFGYTQQSIQKLKQKLQSSQFFWLRRYSDEVFNGDPSLIKGFFVRHEPARFYPHQEVASNLLGYVGWDHHGLFGVEKQFEKTLYQNPPVLKEVRDAKKNIIFEHSPEPRMPAPELYLTIDKAIQSIAEIALEKGLEEAKAKSGHVLVGDPYTGELLAVANYPRFNPNAKRLAKIPRNHALTAVFEPGSVVKPFVVAAALEEGLLTSKTKIDHEEGKLRIGNRLIHDSHKIDLPFLFPKDVLVHSSNVGIYKIATILERNKLHDWFKKFGLTDSDLLTGYPGESPGWIQSPDSWRDIRFANISFGQGFTVSSVALLQAYGALANGGFLMKPYYLKKIASFNTEPVVTPSTVIRRVLSQQTARTILEHLKGAVEEGAKKAKPASTTAAGKTGTSQKVDPITKRYSKDAHLSTFIGVVPAEQPRFVIYVQVDDPDQDFDFGSLWAAPIFAEIAEKTFRYLDVHYVADQEKGARGL